MTEKIITIAEHDLKDTKVAKLSRKGIIAIEQIIGKGEKYLFETNKIEGFTYEPNEKQKFAVLEVTHKEKVKKKDGGEMYKKELYLLDFEKDKVKLISFMTVKDMLETGEIGLYQ